MPQTAIRQLQEPLRDPGSLLRSGSLPLRPGQVDPTYVTAAWIFVAFRVLHGAVHCTFNLIPLRFYLYFVATVAVWFMALRATLTHFRA